MKNRNEDEVAARLTQRLAKDGAKVKRDADLLTKAVKDCPYVTIAFGALGRALAERYSWNGEEGKIELGFGNEKTEEEGQDVEDRLYGALLELIPDPRKDPEYSVLVTTWALGDITK